MNRRRYSRYSAMHECQWQLSGDWQIGHVQDVSVTGAMIESRKVPQLGDRVLFKTESIGIIWGQVVRREEGSFAISFDPDKAKRMGINDLITGLLNENCNSDQGSS